MALREQEKQCKNGPCPAIHDYEPDPEQLAIQGPTLTEPDTLAEVEMPDHESIVLVPRDMVLRYARRILAEEGQLV